MSCKYCERPAFYAVHHGIKVPPIMTCQKHILKGISGVFLAQDTYQVTVQDMNKYALWKNRNFTKNYGSRPKVKDNSYHMTLVDTWLSGFKSIMDAKPIRITFRYARREPLTMVIPAKQWNNLKLAFLERPEIYKIDDAHLAGGAAITHYINRHRAWYLDVWEVARKIKFVFGPLHLDAYQGNMRIEPAPLGFEPETPFEKKVQAFIENVSQPKPGLSLFNPVTPGFDSVRIPLTPEQVQELLEKSLNTDVSISGRVVEKPHYLCQTDFCAVCGDKVTNTGSSFGYNQRVVCLKCFKKADSKPDSNVCATCGSKEYNHALGGKVYCNSCWDKLTCCQCNKIVGYDCTSYNGRVFCKSCYSKLTASKDEKYSPNDPLIPNDCLERKVYTRSEFMAEHPDDPDAHRILGGGVGNVSFIVIDDFTDSKPDSKESVCPDCGGPLGLEVQTAIDGKPRCKTCYDRFYNPEINYRCKGCGAIIPDKGKICNKCGPECAHCKTHQGPFKTIDHKLYCHGCADMCKAEATPKAVESTKECPECGLPLGNHPVAIPNGNAVCRSCYDNEPCCVQCGTVEGPLVDKDESGLKVCKVCYAILHGCPICGKAVNADGVCDCYCARKDDKTSNG